VPPRPLSRRRAPRDERRLSTAGRVALAALGCATAAVAAGQPLPPPVHQTRLTASWDPATRTITGQERLRWRNGSSVAVDELAFHLYLNAFANDRSAFLRESAGRLRGTRFADDGWGFIEVSSLRLPDGTDLAPLAVYGSPDGGDGEDRTVARYPLPRPLPPGAWIEVELDFTSRLPRVFARTGAHGDYVLAGQWYPHIAVFEDAGARGRREPGWNAHAFHANGEFFADFGDYDVTLTLPLRYRGRVGATGRRVAEETAGGAVVVRFVEQGVHDFAWTADPRFRVVRDLFDPAVDVPPEERRRIARLLGVAAEELALSPVDLELLVQPANAAQARRYLDAAKATLRGLGLRLGAYPYGTLTLVDPPLGAYGSGGMEYPTLVTLGTHPLLEVPGLRGILVAETVAVHETAHQWFQGMIATHEAEESWLDEGITTYYESTIMAEGYGPYLVRLAGLRVRPLEYLRRAGLAGRFSDPVVRPAWAYLTRASYGLNSYERPALVLHHLGGLLGEPTLHRALRTFFRRHRFAHPTTADFVAAVEEVAGRDLDWFFRQALYSTRTLDYEVRPLVRRRERPAQGILWEDGKRREPAAGGEEDGGETAADARPTWVSRAVVFRRGEFVHPVTVEFRFADGTARREAWDGEERWARWTFRGAELVSAEVDPDRLMVLDENRLNNGYTVERRPAAALAFLVDLAAWAQAFFTAAGWLA
jgi:hypothetical protein